MTPRVPEPESADVAAELRRKGLQVDYLVFEDEGHDVLRFKNRVVCYNKITEFFPGAPRLLVWSKLGPGSVGACEGRRRLHLIRSRNVLLRTK